MGYLKAVYDCSIWQTLSQLCKRAERETITPGGAGSRNGRGDEPLRMVNDVGWQKMRKRERDGEGIGELNKVREEKIQWVKKEG